MCREHADSFGDIRVVEVAEACVHAVVHITHEDAEIAGLITFQPVDLNLYMLEAQLVYKLASHLISLSHGILSMTKMYGYDVEGMVLESEIVSYSSLVSNSASHGAFGNPHSTHVRSICKEFPLHKNY